MIRVIQPGETGVDFSYSKPPPARLVELGYTFVVGYCSPNALKNLLDPWAYINAGLGLLYVFELTANRPNEGGAAGRQDGAFARAWLQKCGYDPGVPIIVAVDTNTNAANLAAHRAYFDGFNQASQPYQAAAYEDTDLAQYTNAETTIDWLPLAWSWSSSISRADAEAKARALGYHVFQGKGFWIDQQWAVDPNTAIRSFPSWGYPAIAPPPVDEDEDMKTAVLLSVTDLPGLYFWPLGSDPIACASIEDAQALCAGVGINPDTDSRHISHEQFNRLFATPVNVVVPSITVPAAKVAITVAQV